MTLKGHPASVLIKGGGRKGRETRSIGNMTKVLYLGNLREGTLEVAECECLKAVWEGVMCLSRSLRWKVRFKAGNLVYRVFIVVF